MTRVLLVQGRNAPGPRHWLRLWAQTHPEYQWVRRPEGPRFDLTGRVADLHEAVTADPEPAVLVAHSAGCLTVATWTRRHSGPVRAALLVAPPHLDPEPSFRPGDPEPRTGSPGFRPGDPEATYPRRPLPFPAVVVASRTDEWATFEQSAALAAAWGARLVDAGDAGHIDSSSGYGGWPAGEQLLAELV